MTRVHDRVPDPVTHEHRKLAPRGRPDTFDEAVAEADLFFQAEMPAVQRWSFGPSEAGRVAQPILNVLGARSEPRFVEGSAVVQSWFPDAERLDVPDASHLLMLEAIAGRELVERSYAAALEHGYRWHEFGDSHLLMGGRD